MQALGLIEVRGLIAAIESADAMTKSSNVNIIEKNYVGGGLVSVIITGDVGAVKSAIDAGISAVNRLGEGFLVSNHVIARPHEDIEKIMDFGFQKKKSKIETIEEDEAIEVIEEVEEKVLEDSKIQNTKKKQMKKLKNKDKDNS